MSDSRQPAVVPVLQHVRVPLIAGSKVQYSRLRDWGMRATQRRFRDKAASFQKPHVSGLSIGVFQPAAHATKFMVGFAWIGGDG